MAKPFSGLDRLISNLRSSYHDFKRTTDIFAFLDVEKVAKEMQLEEVGAERGRNELPPSSAKGPDEVELRIEERINEAKNTAYNNLEDQLQLFSVRLSNLDFQGQFSSIEKVNSESLTDFKAEISKGRNELHSLRKEMYDTSRDLENFQKKHNLDRSAISTDGGTMYLKVGLLIFFFFLETVGNGILLSASNRAGIIGGIVEAVLFSGLNIIGTLLITLFGIRNIIHRSILRKLIGFFFLLLYLAFALVLNLGLAHYREISGNILDDINIGVQAFLRATENPFGLEDIRSWLLFGGGLLLSVLTAIDAWFLRDPYMGYQAVAKRRKEAVEKYKHMQADLIDELMELRDIHHEKIEEIIAQLSKRRNEYSEIIAHRAKMLSLFAQYQSHLETAANLLLQKYRDANRAERKTPAPKYFSDSYRLKRPKPSNTGVGELTDKEVAEAIKKAQAELSEQIRAISKACEEGIDEYRELDNLFPDEVNG